MHDRPTYRPVYKALHRPLTVCGVDRRLFFLALLMGAATFNLFYSFLAGLLVASGLYGFALWATKRDPQMLRILLSSSRFRPATTPAKHDPIRRGGAPMVSIRRILRDYQDAGSVNSLIALWGFVDDHTFLTKAGHVGLVYRVAGSRLRVSRLDASAATSSIASRRRFGSSTSPAASISTSVKRRIGADRGRTVQPAPGRTKPSSGARHT